ncbi:CHCH domain-containing protein [Aphelenchoides fujianensis]|nr:CHCH domain-containing protein [Aphelenchoides fujianensis]
MVRRRGAASPKPSGPVRASSPPPSYRTSAPAPTAAAPGAGGYQRAGAAGPGAFGAAPPSQGPGLMGQMAATAGGVAIGSAVGHSIGRMFDGGSEKQVEQAVGAPPPQNQYQQQQQQAQTPCEIEWRQFLECSQNQQDMSMCQAYNDLFKQCKARYQM